MNNLRVGLALIIGIVIGYILGNNIHSKWKNSYIDYNIDYKTCVNSMNGPIAQTCGQEVQLRYPELFVK